LQRLLAVLERQQAMAVWTSKLSHAAIQQLVMTPAMAATVSHQHAYNLFPSRWLFSNSWQSGTVEFPSHSVTSKVSSESDEVETQLSPE